jgi:hypothetical protein
MSDPRSDPLAAHDATWGAQTRKAETDNSKLNGHSLASNDEEARDRDLKPSNESRDCNRPEITVKAGERHKAADEGIVALQAAGVAFYQRGRALVRVCEVKARSTSGDVIHVPGIAAVTPAILDRALGQAAQWQRFDPKKKEMVRIDPPRLVVSQILDMAGEWPFPPLAGVIGCPTLRHDGSLLATEGYDLATGLVLRSAVAMPTISDDPPRRDAEAAVTLLLELLAEFRLLTTPARPWRYR